MNERTLLSIFQILYLGLVIAHLSFLEQYFITNPTLWKIYRNTKKMLLKNFNISNTFHTSLKRNKEQTLLSFMTAIKQTMTFTHDWMRKIGRYYPLTLSPSPFLIYSRVVLLLSVWHEKCEMENERMIRLSTVSMYIYNIYEYVSLSNFCPSPFRVYLRALLLKRWSNKKRVLFVWGFCLCCVLFVCVCFGAVRC